MATLTKPTAVYNYEDASGTLLYQVLRFGEGKGKEFRQRRPDFVNRRWINNLDGVAKTLYRLPHLLESKPGSTVYVVEGEKDADNLIGLGCHATTSGGYTSWQASFAEHLRDRSVVILPDNDEAGRKYADVVASSCWGVAASVSIVELPGLPAGGDVSDWLKAGGTRDDLDWLAIQAPAWSPKPAGQLMLTDNRLERASAYVRAIPGAVQGERGSDATYHTAAALVDGFGCSEAEALAILERDYNPRCEPPWTTKDLVKKIRDAMKNMKGQPGKLLAEPAKPTPALPAQRPRTLKMVTAEEAAKQYVGKITEVGYKLTELGLPDLDRALDGGIEIGEMVVVAARPSHGKSLFAMQVLYEAGKRGVPSLMVSAEMSASALGKRVAQYATSVKPTEWQSKSDIVNRDIANEFAGRAPTYIVDDISSIDDVEAIVSHAVAEKGVRIVAVDYAQLLTVNMRASAYERATHVSTRLKHIAKRHAICLIVLCQLGRGVESRERFEPHMSDIKDSGQFEQDADVVLALGWCCKVDQTVPPDVYKIFVCKNRNRGIIQPVVTCKINPARQRIERSEAAPVVMEFDNWNNGDE